MVFLMFKDKSSFNTDSVAAYMPTLTHYNKLIDNIFLVKIKYLYFLSQHPWLRLQ